MSFQTKALRALVVMSFLLVSMSLTVSSVLQAPTCVVFSSGYADDTPMGSPFTVNGLDFTSLGGFSPFINQVDASVMGLQFSDPGLSITQLVATEVTLTAGSWTQTPLDIVALDSSGATVDSVSIPGDNSLHHVTLTGADIVEVVMTGGGHEGVLTEICMDDSIPVELLENRSFEDDFDLNSQPDLWVSRFAGKDRRVCNLSGSVAFSGKCAYRFNGGIGEKTLLLQKVNLTGHTFTTGHTLTLSVQYKTKSLNPKLRVRLSVYYSNPVHPPGLNKAILKTGATTYTLYSLPSYSLVDSSVTQIKVQFQNLALKGTIHIDDASLLYQP